MAFNSKTLITGGPGIDIAEVTTTQKFKLGYTVMNDVGDEFTYIKAGGAIVAEDALKLANSATPLSAVVPTAAAVDALFAIGVVAIASGSYGFVLTGTHLGTGCKLVSSGVAANDSLVASGTAGALTKTAATDLSPQGKSAVCLVDDGDNTGLVALF